MTNKDILEVIKNLYIKSQDKMIASRELFKLNLFDNSASRSYYAVFHILTAVLFTKGLTYSSHKEIIGSFNRKFIKTGIFPKDVTSKIEWLFKARQTGDYEPKNFIDKDTAEICMNYADDIIKMCKEYLTGYYNVQKDFWDK